MSCPAGTGSGESDTAIDRSAMGCDAVVVVLAELFEDVGSDVSLAIDAEFMTTVPSGFAGPSFTTIVKVWGTMSAANAEFVNVTVPVPPTAGAIVDQPAGAEAETNVVFAGVASVTTAFTAVSGPMLAASIE